MPLNDFRREAERFDHIDRAETRHKCVVRVDTGTYSNTVTVYCDANDDSEFVKRKARRAVERGAPGLGMAYRSEKILSRDPQ